MGRELHGKSPFYIVNYRAIALVEDPRVKGRCLHPLDSILFITVAAVIAGADGPEEIADFADENEFWVRQFVDLPNGPPSHDTIGRVLAVLKPRQLQDALLSYIAELREAHGPTDQPRFIQIDGKTARGSYTGNDKSSAIHLVSAWASEHGLTLGQTRVDSKTNEIKAIPEVLEMLDLSGALVTIDAMGTQKSIAKQIVRHDGDYCLALKKNHPTLHALCEELFEKALDGDDPPSSMRSKKTEDARPSRSETRYYHIMPIPVEHREAFSAWEGAKSLGMTYTLSGRGPEETCEIRYYLTSRGAKVNDFSQAVRNHWQIESMHWILDVVFHEDASRVRTGNAAENLSFVRRLVTSLLKLDTRKKSLRRKRKLAAWNTAYLQTLMFGE